MHANSEEQDVFHCKTACGENPAFNVVYVCTLLEEKVLYRTLKGSISAKYLEPLKGSIHS